MRSILNLDSEPKKSISVGRRSVTFAVPVVTGITFQEKEIQTKVGIILDKYPLSKFDRAKPKRTLNLRTCGAQAPAVSNRLSIRLYPVPGRGEIQSNPYKET